MEYTWHLVILYRKWKEVNQQTRGLQVGKDNKIFSVIFKTKMTRIFKAINQQYIMFITNQNGKYIQVMGWKVAKLI